MSAFVTAERKDMWELLTQRRTANLDISIDQQ
jgi:hypothetical protein